MTGDADAPGAGAAAGAADRDPDIDHTRWSGGIPRRLRRGAGTYSTP
jgi:hypothetical protein